MEQLQPLKNSHTKTETWDKIPRRIYLCVWYGSGTDASDGDIVRVVMGTRCNTKVTEIIWNMSLRLLDVANEFCHCLSICIGTRQAILQTFIEDQ